MISKITHPQFRVLQEIALVKDIYCRNFDFSTLNYNNYTNLPYVSKKWLLRIEDRRLVITLDKDDAISFDEALVILSLMKPNKTLKLNDDCFAEILENKIMLEITGIARVEISFKAIKKLYDTILE